VIDLSALALVVIDGAVRIEVRAKPRASKTRLVGVRDGALEVALAAPPVDGEANAALVEVLSRALGVPKSRVTIVRGASGRNKLVSVAGVDAAQVRARLASS
jgi:uncharacterized protein (TIGR00251 family)